MSRVIALALAATIAAGEPKTADPLAGTWVVASTTIGGAADAQRAGHAVMFADGRATFRAKDGAEHSGGTSGPQ